MKKTEFWITGGGTPNGVVRYDKEQFLTDEEKQQVYDNLGIDPSAQLRREIVDELPAVGDPNVIYMVPRTSNEDGNSYDEYMWIENQWEKIGSTDVDLSGYYTKTETDALLDEKADVEDIPTVNDSTITIKQGDITKGTFTTNQSGDATIELDDAPVTSVNTKVGDVVLSASDIMATNAQSVQANLERIDALEEADRDDIDEMKLKLATIEEGAEVNVQGDWNQTDDTADDYIKNKPAIGDGTITIKQGDITKGTFTTNQSGDATIELDEGGASGSKWFGTQAQFDQIPESELDYDTDYYISDKIKWNEIDEKPLIPTKVSELPNDANYMPYNAVKALIPTEKKIVDIVRKYEKWLTQEEFDELEEQGLIEDGVSYHIEGEGGGGSEYEAGDGIDITDNVISTKDWFGTQAEYDAIAVKDPDTKYYIEHTPFSGDYDDLTNKPTIPSDTEELTFTFEDDTTRTIEFYIKPTV